MNISIYKNIFVTRSGIGMKWFRLVPETIHLYPGKRKHFLKYALFQFFFRKKIKLKGKYFIIHNHWCPGYYHWITEALPRLLAAKEHVTGYTLILPESFKGYPLESLRYLYQGEIFWIPQNKNLSIETLLVPHNVPYCGDYDQSTFKFLRKLFTERLQNTCSRNNRKIYVSRKKTGRRVIINENELLPILTSNGFEIVHLEELSFADQVKLMSETSVFISIHGAGLTNMLFMPKGSKVIELQKNIENNQLPEILYKDFASILDLRYEVILCKSDGESIYVSNLFVDIQKMSKILSDLNQF